MRIEDVIESGEGDVDVIEEDDENLSFNMDEVQAPAREALPKGQYNCVIAQLTYARSASANKPMWTAQLEVEDGTYAGKKIFTILSFSEKAIGITKQAIATFAPNVLTSDFNPKKIADSGDLLGTKCRVATKIEKYEDQDQTRVSRWMAPTNSATAFA